MYINNIHISFLEALSDKLKKDNIQKVVAGAVIFFKNGSILLLERASGEFKGGLVEFPSGAVEANESIIESLAREVKEETGLEISKIEQYAGSFDYQSSSGKRTRQFNFIVSVSSNNVKINPSEHSRFHIINPASKSLRLLNISKKTNHIIQNYSKKFKSINVGVKT